MERETRLFEEGGGERGPSGALRGLVYRGDLDAEERTVSHCSI